MFQKIKTAFAGLVLTMGLTLPMPVHSQQAIDTHEVINYYYLHDTIPSGCMKLTSQTQFDSYFGPAAFMGKGGEPTQIDFGREFVVAKVFPETFHAVTLDDVKLSAQGDSIITLHYHYAEGAPRSYSIRPIILLAVPNAYKAMRLTEEADCLAHTTPCTNKKDGECCQNKAENRVLIIWYDQQTGKKPLLKAVRRMRCKLIYDYKMLSGIAICLPQHADKRQMMQYFKDVKGVLGVQEDRKVTLSSD